MCFLCFVAFSYYKDVCVARNSCVYLRFRVFYFLFFRFLLFVSELFNFRSDKRFQIIFYVSVFYSVFESCIFSAISDDFSARPLWRKRLAALIVPPLFSFYCRIILRVCFAIRYSLSSTIALFLRRNRLWYRLKRCLSSLLSRRRVRIYEFVTTSLLRCQSLCFP